MSGITRFAGGEGLSEPQRNRTLDASSVPLLPTFAVGPQPLVARLWTWSQDHCGPPISSDTSRLELTLTETTVSGALSVGRLHFDRFPGWIIPEQQNRCRKESLLSLLQRLKHRKGSKALPERLLFSLRVVVEFCFPLF